MFERWRQYSYAAQKHQRYRLVKIIIGFLVLFIIYNCITAFLFSVWTLDNNTMQPGLNANDRLIFASSALPAKISDINSDGRSLPFARGSVVLVDIDLKKTRGRPILLLDGVVRFFTAQKISIIRKTDQFYIKRVIGLPGDEISMTNYIFRVKPAGSSYSLTEFELANKPYQPAIPQTPALWDESIPFSGSMNTLVLGPDECFVVSDDRANTNDCRTWGPIPNSLIAARAVLRFWPVTKIEIQ